MDNGIDIARGDVDIRRAERIPGWMDPALLYYLAQLARKAKACAEIGCWRGRTTRALADHCRGTVYAVDHFGGSDGIMHEVDFMQAHTGDKDWLRHEFNHNVGDCPNISVLAMPSVQAADRIRDQSLDFCLIDAAHDFQSVTADIRAWFPKIHEGGILCGHDYNFADVRRAVHQAFPHFVPVCPTASLWQVIRGQPRL